jgi:hypothetical protein
MTPHPPIKRTTRTADQPRPAQPALTPTGHSAPKDPARKGAPSALRSDPQVSHGPRVIGWLHVVCPSDWRAPVSATSHCECGHHVTADNRADVIALVKAHAEHRTKCPLHTAPERRQTA